MPHFSITFSKPRINSAFPLFMRGLAVLNRKNQRIFAHIFPVFTRFFPKVFPKICPGFMGESMVVLIKKKNRMARLFFYK